MEEMIEDIEEIHHQEDKMIDIEIENMKEEMIDIEMNSDHNRDKIYIHRIKEMIERFRVILLEESLEMIEEEKEISEMIDIENMIKREEKEEKEMIEDHQKVKID